MVAYRNFVFPIGLLCILVVDAGAGVCPRVKSKFCMDIDGLGYDKTFFPNVLGHEDQREAKEALKELEPLAKTGCSPYISAFLCATYLPACPVWKDNPKKAQKPCRELCETARKDCEGTLSREFGIVWPAELNCDDFPTDDKSRRNPTCTNYLPPRPAFCKKHKDTGPCNTYKPFWYYDVSEHKCMTFTFGGCLGNENKFETKEECLKICGNGNTSTIAPITAQTNGGASDVPMLSSTAEGVGDIKGTTMASGTEETAGSKTHSATRIMTSSPVSGQTDKSMGVSSVKPTDGSTAKPMEGGSSSQPPGNGTEAPTAGSTMSLMENVTTQGMASTMMFSTQPSRTTNEPDGLPVIVNNLDNKVVITGGSVEFRCIALGATEYSWKRVDGEYPIEKVDMEDYDRIQGAVLRMVDLAPEDAGIYACVASNADGYVEALVTLTVVVAPTIETIETPQFLSEGGRLEIECIGDGVPPPTMIWERKNDMKVKSKGSRSKRTLIIKKATSSDAGIYYCIAVNQAGHANYTVEIQIEAAVEIIDDIRSQTILENETAFFVCSATGNPEPQFSWRRLDGEFPDESRVVIEGPILNQTLGYPIYTSILGIEPAFGSDTGSYQCYAFNSVGNYTAVGDLTVVGVPGFSQKPDTEQGVSVGDSAYFTCIGAGAPPYEITWSKESDPGWPEKDSRVFLEDDNTFLRIDDVVPEDSGIYVCTVSNEYGMVTASSNLQVEEALAILIGPSDTKASPGETVQLRCRVTGNPFPTVKWLFNDIAIDPLGLFDRRVEQEGTNLIIRNVHAADSGYYHCLAWSIHGKVMATAVLTVVNGGTTTSPTDGGDVSVSGASVETETEHAEGTESSMTRSPMTDASPMAGTVTMGQPLSGEGTVSEGMESSEPTDDTDAPQMSPETQGSTQAMGSPTQGSTEPMGSPETKGSTEPMGSQETQGSTTPMGSPESQGSTELMGSPETQGSTTPMGSPESQGSTEPMGSPVTKGSTEPVGSPEPGASTEAEMDGSTMGITSGFTEGAATGSPMSTRVPDMVSATYIMSSKGKSPPATDMMASPTERTEPAEVKQRRTDITNPGVKDMFSGWVDVQGQGAANDFCRIVEKDKSEYQLACALAGTEGEGELNYVSGVGFDIGEKDTFYMKDENGDGRFDYCRCTGKKGKRFVWCTAAGENGFYGNGKDEPGTDEYSFQAEGERSELKRCRRRFVDPFFGIPYSTVN